MTLRFAYTQPNGVVAIVIAAPKEDLIKLIGTGFPKTLSDDDYRAHVIERSIPKYAMDTFVELKPEDKLPADRSQRQAWVLDAGAVKIDQQKVKL